jgi:tellurite resistance protein TerC
MDITYWWIAFIIIFVVIYFVDIFVTDHRKGEISVKASLRWTGLWISVALLFGVGIYFFFPQNEGSTANTAHEMGMKFVAGYLTEYSLSVDNLFVFIMVFSMMGIAAYNQPRLLKLGILIAIVLRILFILVGMSLVQRFEWVIYIFGVILIWTAWKMAFASKDEQVNPKSNILYKLASKLFPIYPNEHVSKFFVKENGKRYITMIFLCLLVIGSTDVLFAIDSIPAIIGVIAEGSRGVLSIDEENFLAVSSNVFAVMGLVSLFFALKGIMKMFRFLKYGVCCILLFIGLKMLLGFFHPISHFFHENSWVSLVIIVLILAFSVVLSMLISDEKKIIELQKDRMVEDWETREVKKQLHKK